MQVTRKAKEKYNHRQREIQAKLTLNEEKYNHRQRVKKAKGIEARAKENSRELHYSLCNVPKD